MLDVGAQGAVDAAGDEHRLVTVARTATHALARVPRRRVVGDQDAFGQAVTFAAGVVLFALLGRAVDGWLGTGVLATILGVALGVVASSVTLYYRYQAQMRALDEGQPWSRSPIRGARNADPFGADSARSTPKGSQP